MIDVRMNLDVHGQGKNIKQLVRIIIANKGTGTEARGDYRYRVYGKANQLLKEGEVLHWPRKSKTPIKLLQAVINKAYPLTPIDKP